MIPGLISAVPLLAVLLQFGPAMSEGKLRGHVVDAAGGAIPAVIRVIRTDTNAIIVRFRAEDNGSFETGLLTPGVYSATAFAQGFRRRELRRIIVQPGRVVDLGHIRLDLSGCDTPGTNCDYFGEVPEFIKRVIATGRATLELSCAVDLDRKNGTFCPGATNGAVNLHDADLRFVNENGMLYVLAVNGATFCQPDTATPDCSGVTFQIERIAVAGLGPGIDFCVRTKRGSVSHVFFTDDIDNESTTVALWYVTRKSR